MRFLSPLRVLIVFLFSYVFILSATNCYAAKIKVPSRYKSIQEAIDHATPGDVVAVSSGEYKGNLKLRDGVILQGQGADSTILVGDGSASVVEGAKGAVIEGFTIKGSGDKGTIGVTMDAGISCNNAPMTIANNRLVGNNTSLKLYYSPSNVVNNYITGSKVYGIYLAYSNSLVANNIITGSKSHGIYNSYSNPEIMNNTIVDNFNGMYSEVSRVVAVNNIITGNTNAGIRWAEFIGSQDNAEPILSYNLVWGNAEDYINVNRSEGDVRKDPRFVNAKSGDYRLKAGSPALKSGEKGVDIGAYGGEYAQNAVPSAPSSRSFAAMEQRGEKIEQPDYTSASAWSEGTASGKGNFEGYCVSCHGPNGQGDGVLAETLDVAPRNLSDKSIMTTRTDDMLFKVIKDGGASVGFSENMMPFNNQLSDKEIRNIINYIRDEICKCKYEGGK